ncbi:hypothetical protein GWI33_019066 [Rhynchophorus ferrugineus]|uniref:Uncharacterized protein n=1 Tax=Rhynchophorus ferrugineus TaxID=354439 RepID=A0A834HUK3_RHYFE|nr:hypothetical protein GWI33_019066 [Rhynchophorus ferrugineus]
MSSGTSVNLYLIKKQLGLAEALARTSLLTSPAAKRRLAARSLELKCGSVSDTGEFIPPKELLLYLVRQVASRRRHNVCCASSVTKRREDNTGSVGKNTYCGHIISIVYDDGKALKTDVNICRIRNMHPLCKHIPMQNNKSCKKT